MARGVGGGGFLVKLTGRWRQAAQSLSPRGTSRIRRAIDKAVKQEAQNFRKQVVTGITKQAPGGKRFRPLSPASLIMRRAAGMRGRKALIATGTLRKSIVTRKIGGVFGGGYFVGVLRTARTKNGVSLVNIARIQEEGSGPIVIRVTPAMRRFWFAMLRKVGEDVEDAQGGQVAKGIIVIQIPPRPFLTPVAEQLFQPPSAARFRFMKRIGRNLLGEFGFVG